MKLPDHKFSICALFWRILATLLALISPWCIVQIIDRGISHHDYFALWIWVGIAAVTQVLSGVSAYISSNTITTISRQAEKNKLDKLYHHIFHADLRSLSEQAQGQMMRQLLSAAAGERSFISSLYTTCIPLFVSGIGTLTILLTLSWSLALISLLIIPIGGIIWWWIRKRIRHSTESYYQTQESLYHHIVDSFRAILPIRALHQSSKFIKRYQDITTTFQNNAIDLQKKQAIYAPIFDVIQALALVLIFGLGGYYVLEGNLTIGVLLGFQVYLMRLFGLMRSSTAIFTEYQNYLVCLEQQNKILALSPAPIPSFDAINSPSVLEIHDLSFSFDTHSVWDHFSLTISEGEKYALLIPSGGGKTTLARCILGIYSIDSGTIAIPESNTQTIGFVPQENVLFDGTIRENIELTCQSALSDEKLHQLIRICGLEEVFAHYEKISIGAQGSHLSGGEQRRVMLARALANDPKLLIIDQMASELEPDLCRAIFGRIQESYPKLGILYLGHRKPEWD